MKYVAVSVFCETVSAAAVSRTPYFPALFFVPNTLHTLHLPSAEYRNARADCERRLRPQDTNTVSASIATRVVNSSLVHSSSLLLRRLVFYFVLQPKLGARAELPLAESPGYASCFRVIDKKNSHALCATLFFVQPAALSNALVSLLSLLSVHRAHRSQPTPMPSVPYAD